MRFVSVLLNCASVVLLAMSAALMPVATIETVANIIRFPATILDPLGALKDRLVELGAAIPIVGRLPDRILLPMYIVLMVLGIALIYRTRVGLEVKRVHRVYDVKLKAIAPYKPPTVGDRVGMVYGTQYFGIGLGVMLTPFVGAIGILAGSLLGIGMAAVIGKQSEEEASKAHAQGQMAALQAELQGAVDAAVRKLRMEEGRKVAIACGLAVVLLTVGLLAH